MKQTFKVPIRNLFNMLSYIQDFPEMIEQMSDVDEEIITYDFLARRFLQESKQLIRRGLLKNYIVRTEETGFISGKMLMTESIPSIIQNKPVVVCEKDYYSENIIFNQIMVTTLRDLYQNPHIKNQTRIECFHLSDQFSDVDEVFLSREGFLRLRFEKHNVHYKHMLHLARLLHEVRLLSHNKGDWSLFTVEMSEREMNHLFENFLFHFYSKEQEHYRVQRERMSWKLSGNKSLLPSMETDLTLTHLRENKKIVIDAKFYKNMFQRHFDKDSYHSHNMYQIFTYMMHQPTDAEVRGILIYPANDTAEFSESYYWDERLKMEIYSLNLDGSWGEIFGRLIGILEGVDI